MSSGSFVIESWSKGTEVSYVKNENYLHADEIYLDGINVRVIADESTRLELFEKGELDFLTLGTTGQAQYGDDPRVYFYEAFAVQEIEFNFENPDKPFLSNVNFRKALFYATDRETLAAISGNAPANYFLGRRLVAYADGTSIGQLREEAGYLGDNYSYDPDLAVEYFEKALEETGYDKFSIELIYSEGNESRRVISEYLPDRVRRRAALLSAVSEPAAGGDLLYGHSACDRRDEQAAAAHQEAHWGIRPEPRVRDAGCAGGHCADHDRKGDGAGGGDGRKAGALAKADPERLQAPKALREPGSGAGYLHRKAADAADHHDRRCIGAQWADHGRGADRVQQPGASGAAADGYTTRCCPSIRSRRSRR